MTHDSAHTNPWAIGEVVFGLPFLLSFGLHSVWPLSLHQGIVRWIALGLGVICLLTGLSFIGLARREFARYHQPTNPGQPTSQIITTGVFAISRNPLYLGAVLAFLGIGLAFNLLWVLVALLLSSILCVYVLIIPEERYLTAKFGTEYSAYAQTVRRWLGRS